MKTFYAAILAFLLSIPAAPVALAADGLVKILGARSVQSTMDSLENLVRNQGLTVFVRIDHAAGAAAAGKEMLPTQPLMFGNPAIGTNLMTSEHTVGVDLPIKVLIQEEPDGRVWIAYNDPAYLAERHGIGDRDEVLSKMGAAVRGIVSAAASPQGRFETAEPRPIAVEGLSKSGGKRGAQGRNRTTDTMIFSQTA